MDNSEQDQPKKLILPIVACCLFTVLHLVAAEILSEVPSYPTNQWMASVQSREKVLCTRDELKAVAVGSSLTQRLKLPDGWGNMGIASRNCLTSLSQLCHSQAPIKAVFIETNQLGELEYEPDPPWLIERCSVLGRIEGIRSSSRPLQLILKALMIAELKFDWPLFARIPVKFTSQIHRMADSTQIKNQRAAELNRKFQMRNQVSIKKSQQIRDQACILLSYMKLLHRRGIRTILVELPLDPIFHQCAGERARRQEIDRITNRLDWVEFLPIPSWHKFHTTDGIHLDEEGTRTVPQLFEEYLEKIPCHSNSTSDSPKA